MGTEHSSQPDVLYEFGDFLLDASRHLLFAKGSADAFRVKPRLLETLLYLVEHQGELLSKDRLLADLWPGLVVEENNLTQVISALRQILGESPGEHRYLVTVPGRGYRFVARVSRVPHPTETMPEARETRPDTRISPPPRHRSRLKLLISLGLVVCAALLAYDRYTRWSSTIQATPTPVVTEPAPVEVSPNTVAVLPFENLSADDENKYIASGLAESILHRLANVDGLTLIARTSSFTFHARPVDARDIARALGARYLIAGSLQRTGGRLRVTAQFIDAITGTNVWSLRFDRTIADIFAVEDEIAQAVADALQVSLQEVENPYSRYGTQAYLAFLQGRALIASLTIADVERALERFTDAIEIAPDFAAAYVGLADAYWHIGLLRAHGPGRSPIGNPYRETTLMEAGGNKAGSLLTKALELDETLAEAYILRAGLKHIAKDYAGAEADYQKGLALNPNYSIGHERYALFLQRQGRNDEAHAELDNAIRVDPLAPQNYYFKGFMYMGSNWELAEAYYLKALKIDPYYHPALLRIGVIRWIHGRFADALLLAEQAQAIDPLSNWMRWFLVQFYLDLGDADAARSVVNEATESAEPLLWLSLCEYEGKVPEAEALLRADPTVVGFREHYAYIIRDAALANGYFEEGRRHLLALPSGGGRFDANNPYRLVALAQLSFALGKRDEGERLARQASEREHEPYPRAAALTLLGEHEAAINLLQESVADGVDPRWWYYFDRDPALALLRSDPRFQAVAAKARGHATAERERLESMRERNDIRARMARDTSKPDTC